MDLTGKVIAIMEPRSGVSARTGNAWMTQDYVIEVPGQFPRKMVFGVFGEERIKMFNIQIGEEITVQFDIDAREYNGRYYNDIRAFNVFRGQPAQTVPAASTLAGAAAPGAAPFPPADNAAVPAGEAPFPPAPAAQPAQEEAAADDLPF